MSEEDHDSMSGSAADPYQERLDELFLLEKQGQERLNRLEVHYEQRSELLKTQEASLQALLARQQESFKGLLQKCDEVYGWYREVLRLGSIFLGILLVGLAVIFFWWWHVSGIASNNEEVERTIAQELDHLPLITFKDHRAYVRIVPNAFVPDLKDEDGQPVKGVYAQVYFRDQS